MTTDWILGVSSSENITVRTKPTEKCIRYSVHRSRKHEKKKEKRDTPLYIYFEYGILPTSFRDPGRGGIIKKGKINLRKKYCVL